VHKHNYSVGYHLFLPVAADKQFLERQKDFLKLLVRIQQPGYYDDQVKIAQSYDIESNINNYKVSRCNSPLDKF
jgi:hypothetical protein